VIEPVSSLNATVDFLLRPASYPEPTHKVEAVETHMSWVFLTDQFAYKLKKPAKTSFLDFSTVELRKYFCEEEMRLNRRLAPRVYLGTVAITRAGGGMSIAGEAPAIEWLVKMHRLPQDRMLDQAIWNHTFTEDDIARLATRLSRFYCHAPPLSLDVCSYRRRFEAGSAADLEELTRAGDFIPRTHVERIRSAQRTFWRRNSQLVEQRVKEDRIIEAHGDLRPEHVFLDADPQIIDCLEFNLEFRTLDPVDELAFFAIECEMLGAPAIGATVFARYRADTSDRPSSQLIDFYKCYRAVLRAKLAIWHLREPHVRDAQRWPKEARRYLDLAVGYAERFRLP
jgi:aminoglycoside phosphotransferase family enzyme